MKAIKTIYLCPTNTRGARVKATDTDRNSITLYWADELDEKENHRAAAAALIKKMDWHGSWVRGSLKDCDVWVCVTPWTKKQPVYNIKHKVD